MEHGSNNQCKNSEWSKIRWIDSFNMNPTTEDPVLICLHDYL
ncbi:hypothetical protein VCHENC02_5107A, partial [Vibrio harveyi]